MPLLPNHGSETEEGWAVGIHMGSGRGLPSRKRKAFRDSSKACCVKEAILEGSLGSHCLERDEGQSGKEWREVAGGIGPA